ncbi:(2Fe-2S)-binding protein [Massilia sp. 9I]|uniref:(2Fe-2S)-binding protein n=1 Tax=Massilia sp. 9I TaxID=2653152 RepID=UPI0012F411E6|nr:(2Fe-2S)-binding protein [Massilia sp. 9I]VXC62508.1 Nicotinate dehydrogenase subunit A [Massilia sp. 9I]
MSKFQLQVNGKAQTVDVDADTPLLYVLRNDLKLNGAKFGCGLGQCGACTVMLDKQAVMSCLVPVSMVGARAVRTAESGGTRWVPASVLQQAFVDEQAAQCGYCIAGMIMRATALFEQVASPTDTQIRSWMQPNLCRCGTHMRILRAVRRAADVLAAQPIRNY